MKNTLASAVVSWLAIAGHALLAESPPPLPAPVASFGAAATADGHVYIYGGHAGVRHKYNREEVNGDLYLWQQGMTGWRKLATDEPAQGASLIALSDRVLRVGGMAAQNAKGESEDLWSSETAANFDVKAGRWNKLPKMPERRSSHDSVVVGSTLYVIGGWSLGGGSSRGSDPRWHDTYLTLDLSKPDATWQSYPQPFQRRAVAVQAIDKKIYCIGGMDNGDTTSKAVEVLDTATGQWSKGPALPADKLGGFGYSAIAHEGRLFASGLPGDVLELCADRWTSIAKMAHPRFFHRLVPGGSGRLIALGGESREGKKSPPEIIQLPAAGTSPKKTADKPAAAPSSPGLSARNSE